MNASARYHFDNVKAVLAARWYLRDATSVGPRCRVYGHPRVENKGRLVLADRVRLVSTITPIEIGVEAAGTLEIGSRTFINYGCSIAATSLVRIGARCNIGTYVVMMDNDFHRLEPERRDERPPSAPIIIEDNVWIGGRVTVLRGVTIGADSVVAAGSVVTRDVAPRTVVAGVPAKHMRSL
jgi:maltose O-acetyltransferase